MTKKITFISCAIASLACAASPVSFQTHYISLGSQDASFAIVNDAASNVFIVSNTAPTGIRVTKTDPSGKVVGVMNFGQGSGARGAAVDPQGNLFIVGNGLTAKLDNAIANILATSSIGGSAVATNTSGNVYVAGAMGGNLPTKPGYIVVAELSPDLGTVLHTGLYGSSEADCNPIYDACRGPNGPGLLAGTTATAMAIDPTGAVVVAGYTDGTPAPLDQMPYNYGFVAKFSADLSSITAQASYNPGGNDESPTYFQSVAVDPQGNVLLVGSASGINAIPGGTLQPDPPLDGGGIVMKYDGSLRTRIWGTFFGSALGSGVTVDSQGNIWITGSSQQSLLPNSTSTSIAVLPFVAELTADGTAILDLVSSQFGGKAVSVAPNGTVAVLGPTDAFLLTGPSDQPSLLMVANSANNQSSGTVAPIELISLFGAAIGPESPLGGQVVDGAFTNSLGGYQVLFNGIPAPLLYAGPNQINVVSPAAIANQQTVDIEVTGPAGSTRFPTVFVGAVRPQIFSQQLFYTPVPEFPAGAYLLDYAIAYNQDGTLNSDTDPAPQGSIVTIWATGTGLAGGPLPDGTTSSSGMALNLPITIPGIQVSYAGQAPGAIQGLTQINLQVPTKPPVPAPRPSGIDFQQGSSTTAIVNIVITGSN